MIAVLTRLHIRNLAVLDEIELDLEPGFSVLTGETGAGKSMLVDALALALGERADSTAVRVGAERAEITAIFAMEPKSPAARWLVAQGSRDFRRVSGPPGRDRRGPVTRLHQRPAGSDGSCCANSANNWSRSAANTLISPLLAA